MSNVHDAIEEAMRRLREKEEHAVTDSCLKSVTFRVNEQTLFKLDYLANELQESRSSMTSIIFHGALQDALDAAGIGIDEMNEAYTQYRIKEGKNV